ncbi:MAG TPA: hypothetical protein GXX20_08595 [Clostridiaceae bacterium]|nr:hypothetical protein [Clostridiaceae bacterium]
MSKIVIGNIPVNLSAEKALQKYLLWLEPFKQAHTSPEVGLQFFCADEISIHGNRIYSEDGLEWLQDGSDYEVVIYSRTDNKPIAIMRADSNWRNISITGTYKALPGVFRTMSEIAFRTTILFYQGIVLHASAIDYNGKGLVFSAPSGTGKSTHANLWALHKGAEILNEDRPAIRITEGQVRVFGSPWSGASNHFLNKSAPLIAIFLLEQSLENEVVVISPREALQRLAARCYLPYFDRSLLEMALDNIGLTMEKVPVYMLKCRPDKQSVEKVISWLNL